MGPGRGNVNARKSSQKSEKVIGRLAEFNLESKRVSLPGIPSSIIFFSPPSFPIFCELKGKKRPETGWSRSAGQSSKEESGGREASSGGKQREESGGGETFSELHFFFTSRYR